MDAQAPWLDNDQQDLRQVLLTVVIALPAALDRQPQRDAGISNFEYRDWVARRPGPGDGCYILAALTDTASR